MSAIQLAAGERPSHALTHAARTHPLRVPRTHTFGPPGLYARAHVNTHTHRHTHTKTAERAARHPRVCVCARQHTHTHTHTHTQTNSRESGTAPSGPRWRSDLSGLASGRFWLSACLRALKTDKLPLPTRTPLRSMKALNLKPQPLNPALNLKSQPLNPAREACRSH